MKAEEINVGKLFGSDQQLRIPLWQRHFSWDVVQWSELWTDILRVHEEELESHFLGSIVLNALPWRGLPSEARQFWVVDGQQRITALTLIVCAIRDRLAQLESTPENRAKTQAAYTAQLLRNVNLKEGHVPRLVLQDKDMAVLSPLVDGTWNGAHSSLIERAYAYFKDRVSGKNKQELEDLISIVLAKLTAVWVTLQHGDNAHRVFQTLNAGGKKLRQSDLVRNYFFLLLGDLGNKFYVDHWRQLESDLTDKELGDFLVAWSISQGYTGGKDSLFSYFHKDLMEHEKDPESVLEYGLELTKTATLFRWIRQPGDSHFSQAKQVLLDLRNWSTIPAEGLILWLLRQHTDGEMAEPNLTAALETVLSFMARRQMAGYEPNLHKSIFVATARKLRVQKEFKDKDAADYLRYLLSLGEEVRTWPSDETIKAVARSTPIYSGSRAGWTFAILERINKQMFTLTKHAPPTLDRTKYSVEHVMPQRLTPTWTKDLSQWGVENPARLHESHLHVLGNLTLTPINSELSTLPFAEKRAKLSDDWLRLNNEIASASTWTEHRINERSTMLSQRACEAYVAPYTAEEMEVAHKRFGGGFQGEGNDEVADVQAALEEEGG